MRQRLESNSGSADENTPASPATSSAESPSLVAPTSVVGADVCARRGGRWLSTEDLEAHLAAVVRLENVGTLLGAGASMGPLGGRAMGPLWDDFVKEAAASAAFLAHEKFYSAGARPNPEAVADAVEVAALEWSRVGDGRLPGLQAARADLDRAVIRAALLQPEWWRDPAKVDFDTPELKSHRTVLQKLTSARQPGQPAPWIFTTNYDLAIEWAAESINLKLINGFDGLHRRAFSPHNFDLGWRNVLARGEARFGTYHFYLAKLHGSLSWHELPDGSVVESAAGARWPSFEQFLGGNGPLDGVLVLPSVTKYQKTIGFVMGELVRRFSEFLGRPQTCLITNGFSFSDDHLNRVMTTALQNPTLQLVMYLPEARRDGDGFDTSNCSTWARRVLAMESPQVTVVGGGTRAHFAALASDLPDPAIYDAQALEIRKRLRELRFAGPASEET
ncbi:MAG: SIR2 family protein [Deltaproteobacteria bacterium]|nr:SIR2 family protein [Deltaproteobacteria bacterium]